MRIVIWARCTKFPKVYGGDGRELLGVGDNHDTDSASSPPDGLLEVTLADRG